MSSGEKIDLISIANIINNLVERPVPVFVCKEGLANEYTASDNRLRAEGVEMLQCSKPEAIDELLKYYYQIKEKIEIYGLLYQ